MENNTIKLHPINDIKGRLPYDIDVSFIEDITKYDLDNYSGNFYMLLDHALIIGEVKNGTLSCANNYLLNNWQSYIQELRLFNASKEIHIYRRLGKWHKRSIENDSNYLHFDTAAYIWGTTLKIEDNSIIAFEERGTHITIPKTAFDKFEKFENIKDKRIKIMERHYITYNEIHMPTIVDKRILNFKIV